MRALLLIAALAACGSSSPNTNSPAPPAKADAHGLPALFAHVPAGTPYLVAAIDPLDAQDLKLAEAIIGPGITDSLPKYPAVAPFIAVALWRAGEGSPFWVGVYLSVMALLTLISLLLGTETKDVDIEA